MLEVCFSAHPNIQYRTFFSCLKSPAAPAPGIPLGHRPFCPAPGRSAAEKGEKNGERKDWKPL